MKIFKGLTITLLSVIAITQPLILYYIKINEPPPPKTPIFDMNTYRYEHDDNGCMYYKLLTQEMITRNWVFVSVEMVEDNKFEFVKRLTNGKIIKHTNHYLVFKSMF